MAQVWKTLLRCTLLVPLFSCRQNLGSEGATEKLGFVLDHHSLQRENELSFSFLIFQSPGDTFGHSYSRPCYLTPNPTQKQGLAVLWSKVGHTEPRVSSQTAPQHWQNRISRFYRDSLDAKRALSRALGSGLITELPGPQDVGLGGVLTPASTVMHELLQPSSHACFSLLSFARFCLCLAYPVVQSCFSKLSSQKIGEGGERGEEKGSGRFV